MANIGLFANLRDKMRGNRDRKSEEHQWIRRQYAAPSPTHIKRAVLLRNGVSGGTWVETGTFMGDTAALLALEAKEVYTIEPDKELFEKAMTRFKNNPKIHVIHGLSEQVLPSLLATLTGTVNFWLDGHYSGGITHQGPIDCPVREELSSIEKTWPRYDKATILIDDIRCFDPSIPEYADYPDLNFLVD
ncbi:MAG: hypothetical protein WBQ69_00865 [Gallionella sp.]